VVEDWEISDRLSQEPLLEKEKKAAGSSRRAREARKPV